MGISCDLEVGSMESEAKPTCNKEFVKLNGQDICNEIDATTAKIAVSVIPPNPTANACTNVRKTKPSTDIVIDLVSPPQPTSGPPQPQSQSAQETETIVIIDDAEPEEGEIIATDSDVEYEAISSDEEYTLRQQIEALEAKNRELEKIASISSRAIDYNYIDGYYRPSVHTNYKAPLANRSNITKTNPPLSSASNYKSVTLSHVENISSDEAQLIDSENEVAYLFDGGRSHGRSSSSHRSSSKKEKRQSRRKTRTSDGEKERCLVHGKRRCIDIDCHTIDVGGTRKKRVRYKYDERKIAKGKYSSDSEDELLRNREELKMALNIIAPSNRTVNSSTLLHKLSAVQNQPQRQSLDDSKRSFSAKHRKRKTSRSLEHDVPKRKSTRSDEKSLKRSKNERDPNSKSKSNPSIEIDVGNDNDIQDDDDEAISLEEQELRLIALKSAVLKKHEARKKKQQATMQAFEQIVRPYSPTDSVVLVPDDTADRSNDCCIDSDNNNMDISPISSPTNQYQPMDMELASSNENSNSPIFSYEKPQTFSPFDQFIDWTNVHIPVPINAATYVEMDHTMATMSSPYTDIQSTYPLMFDTMQKQSETVKTSSIASNVRSHVNTNEPTNDNEDELRAQLIEQMRGASTSGLSNSITLGNTKPSSNTIVENIVPKESVSNVDSLEEDCLRSLLLSSKGKKSNNSKEITNEIRVPSAVLKAPNSTEPIENVNCDDMPKLTLNLREALKRLKNNQQNKLATSNKTGEKRLKLEIGANEDCDHTEIQKTGANKHVDKNENELSDIDQSNSQQVVPSIEREKSLIAPLLVDDGGESERLNKVIDNNNSIMQVSTETDTEPKNTLVEQKPIVDDAKVKITESLHTNGSNVLVNNESSKQQSIKTAKIVTINKPKDEPIIETDPVVEVVRAKSATPPVTITKLGTTGTTGTAPPATVAAASAATAVAYSKKMESIRKSSASPVITTWTVKPVKKLIISLNEDSSSDNDDNSSDPSNTFQLQLDQFLQKVRANTDAVQKPMQPAKMLSQKVVSKETIGKNSNNITQKTPVTPKLDSSKTVAHLPMSSQLEYHRLLNRMKQLEKQKEQKSRQKCQQQSLAIAKTTTNTEIAKTDGSFSNITVVVQNENLAISNSNNNKSVEMNGEKINTTTNTTKISMLKTALQTTTNASLAKRVLVKNAIDSLNVPKSVNKPTSTVKAATDGASKIASEPEPKPMSMSLALFAKKAQKVKASILANYIKRYHNHGEQYLNGLAKLHRLTTRTHVEIKKQQKLEQVLDELRRQQKIIEAKLTQQNTLTKSLYPTISATEKTVASDRILMQKLENCCNRLGYIVKGSDYKIKCEKETEIKEKIKQIAIEKNKLKILAQKPTTPQMTGIAVSKTEMPLQSKVQTKLQQELKPPAQPPKIGGAANTIQNIPKRMSKDISSVESNIKAQSRATDKPIDCTMVASSRQSEIKSETTTTDSIGDKTALSIELTTNKSTDADVKELPEPFNDVKISNKENVLHEVERDENIIARQTATVIEIVHSVQLDDGQSNIGGDAINMKETVLAELIDDKALSSDNLTTQTPITTTVTAQATINAYDNETSCGKYDSPLDHLQNCIDSKPDLSAADRNAIVCPYDLMGRCEDKQCEYKHLSM